MIKNKRFILLSNTRIQDMLEMSQSATHVYDQEQEIYIAVKHKNPRHVRDVTFSHTCL